jgi:serine/threonine protein kinase
MELTVQNVYGLLLRSKLLGIEEAKAMYARWQGEAKDSAANLAKFAAWMVQHRYVTDYQATLLARGHADGFFLNEYKILDRLGKGRMAGVYLAQHQLGQVVAIKVLPPSKARDANLLARFKREARLAVKLKHPNIVRTFQLGQSNDLYFLVMEFLPGETLADVLAKRQKFPPTEAVRLIHQGLQGLGHIQAQGLVHRDLKPSNLMLVGLSGWDTTAATLKILDIGLGRQLFDETAGPQLEDGLTGEGVLLGTPDYMSPEQARDPRTADVRADIYSLGCVLYHLLAGQPPFPDTNIISQMIRHATETPRPLKDFNPAIPDGLQMVVSVMMAKDPAARYATPERAAQTLQQFLADGQEDLAAPESDPKMRSYLTWVETENVKHDKSSSTSIPVAAQAAVPGPAPAQVAVPTTTPVAPAAEPAAVPVAAPAAIPVTVNEPAAPPPAPKPPTKDNRPPSHHGERGKKRSKKKGSHPTLPPVPQPLEALPADPLPVPVAVPGDVELVPMTPMAVPAAVPAPASLLSRRDFVSFTVGAGSGALAAVVGFSIALWRKNKAQQQQQQQQPPPDDNDK